MCEGIGSDPGGVASEPGGRPPASGAVPPRTRQICSWSICARWSLPLKSM